MVFLTSLIVVLDVFSFDAAEASCISREITRVPRAILLTMYDLRWTMDADSLRFTWIDCHNAHADIDDR